MTNAAAEKNGYVMTGETIAAGVAADGSAQESKKNIKKHRQGISSNRMLSGICFLLIIGFWCAASYGKWVDEMFLPSPTAVLSKLVSMARDGSLWANCQESTVRVLIGWFWSAVIALPVGMLMANSKRFCAFIQPIIEFARYLPVVALVPLTLLYLGIGESQKYTIIFLGTFFQLVLMVMRYGIRS